MSEVSSLLRVQSERSCESDLGQIQNDISGYNKGPVAKVWAKVMALWRYAKDPNAPWWGRALAIGALVYLVSPLDAVPDPIPVAGLLDDVAVIIAAVKRLHDELGPYL
ncbi:DUF1232 domain-containing protein [bacterium]|nr:DUF1232 domain-containing protein [bacterium]